MHPEPQLERIAYWLDFYGMPAGMDWVKVREMLTRAAAEWNRVFDGIARLEPAPTRGAAHVVVGFAPIDQAAHPGRVAQTVDLPGKRWRIEFHTGVRWQMSFWDRLLGRGENLQVNMVHELGHLFDLQHSPYPQDVMFEGQAHTWRIGADEAEMHRHYFEQNIRTS